MSSNLTLSAKIYLVKSTWPMPAATGESVAMPRPTREPDVLHRPVGYLSAPMDRALCRDLLGRAAS